MFLVYATKLTYLTFSRTVVAVVGAKRGSMTTAATAIPVCGILTPDENLVGRTTAIAAPNSIAASLSSSALKRASGSVFGGIRLASPGAPRPLQLKERIEIKLLVGRRLLVPAIAVLVPVLEH